MKNANYYRAKKKPFPIGQCILILVMVAICALWIVPIWSMLETSFHTDDAFTFYGLDYVTEPLTFETYEKVLSGASGQPVAKWFTNSLVVAVLSTFLTVLVDSLAAYGYARLNFKGKNLVFTILMITMMIPGVINLIPQYAIVSALNLKNKIWALILPGLSGVGNIFLIRQFMYSVPTDLDNAAAIDGASKFRTYFQIILPQIVPVLVTVAMFTFLGSWNDLLWPSLVMSDENLTLTAGLEKLKGEYDREKASIMAAASVSAVPVLIIYLFSQKFLLQGISLSSGVKE